MSIETQNHPDAEADERDRKLSAKDLLQQRIGVDLHGLEDRPGLESQNGAIPAPRESSENNLSVRSPGELALRDAIVAEGERRRLAAERARTTISRFDRISTKDSGRDDGVNGPHHKDKHH